jgi:hypothetical protein
MNRHRSNRSRPLRLANGASVPPSSSTDPPLPSQFRSPPAYTTDPDAYAASSPYTPEAELDRLIAAGLGNYDRTPTGQPRRQNGMRRLPPRYTTPQV